MSPLISTLLHLLELVIVLSLILGTALLVKKFFGIDVTPTVEIAIGLFLAGVMKYLRADPNSPVNDYVNQ